jgi:hypothetical protein
LHPAGAAFRFRVGRSAVSAQRPAIRAWAENYRDQGLVVIGVHTPDFAFDVHLVLGPSPGGQPVRFRVTVDGAAPDENYGADVDAAGDGIVNEQRLYQLVRQTGTITDRTFEIRFLDPGVQAFAFTFG